MKKKQRKQDKENSQNNEEITRLKNSLARALADYDNLTKRVQRDSSEVSTRVKVQIINQLLPAFDMLFEAQKHIKDNGLAMAIKELEDSLSAIDVAKIKTEKGDQFNQDLHEAIDIENAGQKGKIINVDVDGWRIKDGPIIRHSKVIVSN